VHAERAHTHACRLAGGPEKVKLVEEKFKFDKCIDYKKAGDQLHKAIKEACPQGSLLLIQHWSLS
jgi:NADPH-dependent curcumin reductase CurA